MRLKDVIMSDVKNTLKNLFSPKKENNNKENSKLEKELSLLRLEKIMFLFTLELMKEIITQYDNPNDTPEHAKKRTAALLDAIKLVLDYDKGIKK